MLRGGKLAFIGAGVMAEVIAEGLIRTKVVAATDIVMSHYRPERLEELRRIGAVATTTDNRVAYQLADASIICVRPQGMEDTLRELKSDTKSDKLLMSIAAGLPIRFYERVVGAEVPFIRVMPTFFGRIRAGTTALALNQRTSTDHLALASRIFAAVSENVIVLPDGDMDAFTTFGSTTTAAVYMVLDALTTAGSLVGLRHQVSHKRAVEQVLAAARSVQLSEKSAAQLLDEICTPGGVTVEGVKVLEERATRGAAIDAILAAMDRARSISRAASSD